MKSIFFLISLCLFSFCTSEKCMYAGCGCAPFDNSWCSDSSFSAGWCSESGANCAQCSGVYCAESSPTTTSSTTTSTTTSPSSTTTTSSSSTSVAHFFQASSAGYSGEGTYYKQNGGATSCAMTQSNMELARSLQNVAINEADYFDGITCGMCIEVKTMEAGGHGNDVVATPFVAVVTDLCPSNNGAGCAKGDIDILIDDSSSLTGRNPITWRPVDCPVASEPFRFRISSSSNGWYTKLQVRHAKRPVASVSVIGKDGSWVNLRRTPGFFDTDIPNVDDYILRPLGNEPINVRVCDIFGNCENDVIPDYTPEVDQVGVHQFPN